MNIYVSQLKKSIAQKLENVNDADYLATLDAILTYETISSNGKMQNPVEKKTRKRFLSFFFV
ncbi:hypothetical protein BH09BAC5_BH09BAC5_14570 [soil metagenome]